MQACTYATRMQCDAVMYTARVCACVCVRVRVYVMYSVYVCEAQPGVYATYMRRVRRRGCAVHTRCMYKAGVEGRGKGARV
jgi:hypothetical protein